jgi:hypothetical protein
VERGQDKERKQERKKVRKKERKKETESWMHYAEIFKIGNAEMWEYTWFCYSSHFIYCRHFLCSLNILSFMFECG